MDYYTVNENFISDIRQGYVTDAKKLMEHELFDANYSGERGSTHLEAVAASRDNPEIMKALIDKGADSRQYPYALILASHWGYLGNMAVLIDHGADIHAKRYLQSSGKSNQSHELEKSRYDTNTTSPLRRAYLL